MTSLAHREAEFLIDQTDGCRTRVEARFNADAAWRSLEQVAHDTKTPSGDAA